MKEDKRRRTSSPHSSLLLKCTVEHPIVPYSSSDGFCWSTRYGIDTVSSAILFIIQEPSGVCQASNLNPLITHLLQLLCHSIHIQEHSCPSSTARATLILQSQSTYSWLAYISSHSSDNFIRPQDNPPLTNLLPCFRKHSEINPVLSNNLIPQEPNPALVLHSGIYICIYTHI